jgi:hypothetical protein
MKTMPLDAETLRADYHHYTGQYGTSRAVTAMATDYGVNAVTVRRRLAAAGIRRVRDIPARPPSADLRLKYEEASATLLPRRVTASLAAEYGVTQTTIRQWLDDDGLRAMTERIPPKPILEPCPCGAVATTRYRGQDPPLCFTCYMRIYAADKTSNFRRGGREYIAEVKRGAACTDCGGKFEPCALQFDHVPERGPKLFNLGNGDHSIDAIKAEIAKCDIVCANCHAIRTWKGRGLPWIRRGPLPEAQEPTGTDGTLF